MGNFNIVTPDFNQLNLISKLEFALKANGYRVVDSTLVARPRGLRLSVVTEESERIVFYASVEGGDVTFNGTSSSGQTLSMEVWQNGMGRFYSSEEE